MNEGKYLYCIIEEVSYRNFGPIGIGGRGDEVHTLSYGDLACVISSSPKIEYLISRNNLLSHERVLEEIMKGYTVLPIRFGTVATSNDEVRSLLKKRYQELRNLLRAMENKVEVGFKAFWPNMKEIFKEIATSNREVNQLKEKLQKKNKNISFNERIALGEKVKKALEKKRETEAEEMIQSLKSKCIDFRVNKPAGDNMALNSAFLIDRSQEREFDDLIESITEKYKHRYKFKYIAPSPPFNFVNLVIRWGAED